MRRLWLMRRAGVRAMKLSSAGVDSIAAAAVGLRPGTVWRRRLDIAYRSRWSRRASAGRCWRASSRQTSGALEQTVDWINAVLAACTLHATTAVVCSEKKFKKITGLKLTAPSYINSEVPAKTDFWITNWSHTASHIAALVIRSTKMLLSSNTCSS